LRGFLYAEVRVKHLLGIRTGHTTLLGEETSMEEIVNAILRELNKIEASQIQLFSIKRG